MNVGTPGCPIITFTGIAGRPRDCGGYPSHTAVIRRRKLRAWVRIFPCSVHAVDVSGAEPMTDRHRALLAERREQVGRALRGLPYVETPTSPDRDGV